MLARGLVLCGLGLALATAAEAHHPGSHASRREDGRVSVDLVATVADSCMAVAEVRLGTPPGVVPPPDSTPVTARLRREERPCAAGAAVVRSEHVLDPGGDVRRIHLYVLSPDGSLAATERIPVR